MILENEFYTLAFLKAFAKSENDYAARESALILKIAAEDSVIDADLCYKKLNETAAELESEIDEVLKFRVEC
ncbi:MAG: hypothetical protein II969_17835 [Anaerolineaceae bacterium]|nr:hypothetical protein [Anaerolineaceae bacterium]